RAARAGQFLVEAIVAGSVLIIGFMGVLGLLSQSFRMNRIATDNYRGIYLAAEGIEIVKNMIDSNTIQNIANCTGVPIPCAAGIAWDYLPGFITDNQSYVADYSSVSLAVGAGQFLRFDPATNLYGYGSGAQTNFRRTIRIRHIPPPPPSTSSTYEILVRSTVTWSTGIFQSRVELDDTFYDWYPIQ
ncbi:MAG: hypothetical protein Q8P49_02465, partial [Candidatus Liptonbacteria bacterium]|nr:hypothetical protein [Candidatus Liptonbacteria bacterium]